ncbi:acyl transferase 4-like [Iris pallida]|uniref:Acyl transferase 4-like n=1 Tax=Iris pallida TaxID=29817 RepID=A0AAX6EF17_IRIPA|nr:acyl transferase 4-like [Iris pallida]
MGFTVTKNSQTLVVPSEPTPSGCLPLSFFDRLPMVRMFGEMIHVFGRGVEPAKVIREAVAKVLVPYYPVAGRLTEDTDDGQLQVACTGEGVWFTEASADCSLEDVSYLRSKPLMIPKEELLPSPPGGVDHKDLIFMIQVTQFKCGGFTVAHKNTHVVFDGIGTGQFITALSELARGLVQPTVEPVWCREAIPTPNIPPINMSDFPAIPSFVFEHRILDIPLDDIRRVRKQFMEEMGLRCSVFDIVSAKVWQSRTRAIGLPSDADVSVNFTANIRQELCKELPAGGGYYGNCIHNVTVKATSGRIAGEPLVEVTKLVKEGKEGLSAKFARWLQGDPSEHRFGKIDYGTMCLTDLRRAGFLEADYGWGTPEHVVPLNDSQIGICILINSPPPMTGVRVMASCVEKEHLDAFCNEMKKLN